MLDEQSALTLLGESADWLKDNSGGSVRDRRLAWLEAYRSAWDTPEDETRHEALRAASVPLFEALRHNHLYPDEHLLAPVDQGAAAFLPSPASARKDFERIRSVAIVNKFGIGEVHLLYLTYLLLRMLSSDDTPYDSLLEKHVGDVIFLREPLFRADNQGVFSSELKARYHAVQLMRCMKAIGLLDDKPIGKVRPEDQAEMRRLLADDLSQEAGQVIPPRHHMSFVILDAATALDSFSRAHAGNQAPADERTPEELFRRLRRHVRRLARREDVGPERRERLLRLAVAGVVRAIAHVDLPLGRQMYSFLRSSRYKRRIRHMTMFQMLPNTAERLRFLNFLYFNGQQDPTFYVERFKAVFPKRNLRFVSKSDGFTLEPAATRDE